MRINSFNHRCTGRKNVCSLGARLSVYHLDGHARVAPTDGSKHSSQHDAYL
ncbi:hypothetical protein VFPFJ_02969 [Purpureocillium lilacinum]|uniref:Uncharacterized protein n=1 Tax=Purpureocillium lilacinum TaxID=33203 RepID=A0A179HTK4_PURLI|nr:hypothetical protein VFPFJ_02969 [Purpureocillium lilacinum]OAQ93806.1 hypothetical protein VFPFJ_02969 [Purpureocillium lilacinum]